MNKRQKHELAHEWYRQTIIAWLAALTPTKGNTAILGFFAERLGMREGPPPGWRPGDPVQDVHLLKWREWL